jgi:methionyl-tRNA formyltransferase
VSPPTLKIIFAGTPEFSAVALQALIQSRHRVVAVYTQPDRPAGRGRKLTASPVKELALQHNIPVFQPLSLRDPAEQKILQDLKADIMVVAAYGLLLPLSVLQAPRLGCVNIHTSLLPRWRGAAPIQRAILAGDTQTGITIIQMNEGLDTGEELLKKECAIQAADTSATLHARLADLGATVILRVLDEVASGTAKSLPQDNANATYAKKITKEEAHLHWHESAKTLQQKVQAFNPWPVAYFQLGDQNIRVWQACEIQEDTKKQQPGTILKVSPEGMDIATGENILRLQKLQLPGGKILAVNDILNSRQQDFAVGKVLG